MTLAQRSFFKQSWENDPTSSTPWSSFKGIWIFGRLINTVSSCTSLSWVQPSFIFWHCSREQTRCCCYCFGPRPQLDSSWQCECLCMCVSIWTPGCADSWTCVSGRPWQTSCFLPVFPAMLCSHLHFISTLLSSLKSKGNQWTLAETGQPRARLTSNQPCTQTHQDTLAAHTASNLPGVCTQTAQLTDTGNHYERQTICAARMMCMLNVQIDTHSHAESLCDCFVASPLAQLQFAVRQDSQGWSEKCQQIFAHDFVFCSSRHRDSWPLYIWQEFRCHQTVTQSVSTAQRVLI